MVFKGQEADSRQIKNLLRLTGGVQMWCDGRLQLSSAAVSLPGFDLVSEMHITMLQCGQATCPCAPGSLRETEPVHASGCAVSQHYIFLKICLLYFMRMGVFACMWLCTTCVQCPWRPEESLYCLDYS